jgi:hypothetical protein
LPEKLEGNGYLYLGKETLFVKFVGEVRRGEMSWFYIPSLKLILVGMGSTSRVTHSSLFPFVRNRQQPRYAKRIVADQKDGLILDGYKIRKAVSIPVTVSGAILIQDSPPKYGKSGTNSRSTLFIYIF